MLTVLARVLMFDRPTEITFHAFSFHDAIERCSAMGASWHKITFP